MSQLPRQLTIPGPDGLPFDAVRAPCKTGYRTTDSAPCCGPGCLLYKAVRCNQVCGYPTPAAIYVCKDLLCACPASYTQCPPCNRPIEAGMFVRYGAYCYKIQTDVVYCPEFGARVVAYLAGRSVGRSADGAIDGCVPLPQGAEVAVNVQVDCCKTCFPANGCPEIQGWFPMVPCVCPNPGAFNCVAYVTCQAYFSSLGTSNCPVWMVNCQAGGDRCLTVRPDAVPVPDPPPGARLVTTRATYRNCCQCCGTGGVLGCCFEVFTPFTLTWSAGGPPGGVQVFGTPYECCRVKSQTTYSGVCTTKVYFRWAGTQDRCLIRATSAKVEGNEVVKEYHTYLGFLSAPPPLNCGGEAPGSPVIERIPIPPCTNAFELLSLLMDTRAGNGLERGQMVSNCDRSSITFTNLGNDSLSECEQNGFAAVGSAEGCGNMNCQPGGGNRPEGSTMPSLGCSGCGSSAAATKF